MRKRVRLPAAWFSIMPGKGILFWVEVKKLVKARAVRSSDIRMVRAIAREVSDRIRRRSRPDGRKP